jgi:hypothetical protein
MEIFNHPDKGLVGDEMKKPIFQQQSMIYYKQLTEQLGVVKRSPHIGPKTDVREETFPDPSVAHLFIDNYDVEVDDPERGFRQRLRKARKLRQPLEIPNGILVGDLAYFPGGNVEEVTVHV